MRRLGGSGTYALQESDKVNEWNEGNGKEAVQWNKLALSRRVRRVCD